MTNKGGGRRLEEKAKQRKRGGVDEQRKASAWTARKKTEERCGAEEECGETANEACVNNKKAWACRCTQAHKQSESADWVPAGFPLRALLITMRQQRG
jgi:hypothetical protein